MFKYSTQGKIGPKKAGPNPAIILAGAGPGPDFQ